MAQLTKVLSELQSFFTLSTSLPPRMLEDELQHEDRVKGFLTQLANEAEDTSNPKLASSVGEWLKEFLE